MFGHLEGSMLRSKGVLRRVVVVVVAVGVFEHTVDCSWAFVLGHRWYIRSVVGNMIVETCWA